MTNWKRLSEAEQRAYWTESERLLLDLLADCRSFLADQHRQRVQKAIEHNEHGLALEHLFDYLVESACEYSDELRAKFRILAARIPMTGSRDIEHLVG